MTAQEFLTLSTKLFNDMKAWVAEASKADRLVPSDLAMLEASMNYRAGDIEGGRNETKYRELTCAVGDFGAHDSIVTRCAIGTSS